MRFLPFFRDEEEDVRTKKLQHEFQQASVQEITRYLFLATHDKTIFFFHEPEVVAIYFQEEERTKKKRQYEDFRSSCEVSHEPEICVDELVVSTCDYGVCWFSPIPEYSDVEYEVFIR